MPITKNATTTAIPGFELPQAGLAGADQMATSSASVLQCPECAVCPASVVTQCETQLCPPCRETICTNTKGFDTSDWSMIIISLFICLGIAALIWSSFKKVKNGETPDDF